MLLDTFQDATRQARVLLDRGEYGRALTLLDETVGANRPEPPGELIPEALLLRAACLRALGRMDEARRDAAEACRRRPSDEARRMVAELDFILARNNGLELSNLRRELRAPARSLARLAEHDEALKKTRDAAQSLSQFLDWTGELERGWRAEYAARPTAWSMGYILCKQEVLEGMVEAALAGEPRPETPFGPGLDERMVEIPWALGGLGEAKRVLDAGSALNHPGILGRLRDRDLTIATLYPERHRDDAGVSYVYEDLRDLPFKNDWFDAVVCLSTIEHIGHATEGYKGGKTLPDKDTAQGGDVAAAAELVRVTRPGGRILISAPFGDPASGGADFKVYDEPAVQTLVKGSGGRLESLEHYHFTAQGWTPSSARECRDTPYRGNGSPGAGAVFLLTIAV